MAAYYNEFDKPTAAWLRELIRRGLIAPGDVDERSIKEVQPDDLRGYDQVHFFAGIGGWSYALRLAGVADDFAVWTGSCPCQPFSAAGNRRGADDDRHLWPEMFRLVSKCRPDVVFGEQVESAIRHGWLDGISADLEGEGYAVGHCVLGAHSVGAPHIRQRLYWLADANSGRLIQHEERDRDQAQPGKQASQRDDALRCGRVGRLSNAERTPGGTQRLEDEGERSDRKSRDGAVVAESCNRLSQLAVAESEQPYGPGATRRGRSESANGHGLGDTGGEGLQERDGDGRLQPGPLGTGPWQAFELASCRDGKSRRVAPGVPLLAHGIPGRVGRLRGFGNAIVPQVAAEFIAAYFEAKEELGQCAE